MKSEPEIRPWFMYLLTQHTTGFEKDCGLEVKGFQMESRHNAKLRRLVQTVRNIALMTSQKYCTKNLFLKHKS